METSSNATPLFEAHDPLGLLPSLLCRSSICALVSSTGSSSSHLLSKALICGGACLIPLTGEGVFFGRRCDRDSSLFFSISLKQRSASHAAAMRRLESLEMHCRARFRAEKPFRLKQAKQDDARALFFREHTQHTHVPLSLISSLEAFDTMPAATGLSSSSSFGVGRVGAE